MKIQEQAAKIDGTLPVLFFAVACTLSAIMVDTRPLEVMGVTALTVLFLLFVKDLRLLVPIVLIFCPLGPRFSLSFGNLYLTTAILLIAYCAWFWRMFLTDVAIVVPQTPPAKAMAVMLAVFTASLSGSFTLLTSDIASLFRVIQVFLYTGLFLVVLEMDFEPLHAKLLMILVLLIGAIEVGLGIGQVMTRGSYISGTFDGMYTSYGAYMTFIGILILGVLLEARDTRLLLASFAMAILVCFTMIFSFCRTAYVAFPIGLATMIVMPFRLKSKLWLSVGVLLAFTLVPKILNTEVAARAISIALDLSGQRLEVSFGTRLRLWGTAISYFLDNPVLGSGLGTYGLADNGYLRLLAETGLVGISAFIWLIISILKATWDAARASIEDSFMRGIAKALLPATVACIVVFNTSGDYFIVHRLMGIYWIVLAVMLNYVERCSKCKSEFSK